MKLMTLNIWGGHVHKPLLDFFQQHNDVDIFCLQEVYHQASDKVSTEDRFVSLNIFSELHALLPNHDAYFRPVVNNVYGIAMFVKKNIDVIGEGEIIIHENPEYSGMGPAHSRILQWMECRLHDQLYSILNVHCLWNGKGKTDTPERIDQSQRIKDFIDTIATPKILCGDFNLRPDTESMHILEKNMDNLIKRYDIRSTRTSYYPKDEKFADYILVSHDIEIKHFEVLKDEVSDHAALMIEF